jgi:hypothetical protein
MFEREDCEAAEDVEWEFCVLGVSCEVVFAIFLLTNDRDDSSDSSRSLLR